MVKWKGTDRLIQWAQRTTGLAAEPHGLLLRLVGRELVKRSDHEGALAVFEVMARLCPHDYHGVLGAAKAARRCRKSGVAVAHWAELRRRFPERYEGSHQRLHAQGLMRLGQWAEASALFEELDRLHPERSWGCEGLARIAEKTERWDEAARLWRTCLHRFPEQVRPQWRKRMKQAQARQERRGPSEAARAYSEMLRQQSEAPTAHGDALNFRSIIVVTYGRSGSTLLQGILNTIGGVLIRGENYNALYHLFQLHDSLRTAKERFKTSQTPNKAWYGIASIDLDRLMSQFREIARTIILADRIDDPGVRCFGFKEIRFHEVGERFADYLDFLGQLFPEPAFIFNTRDLDNVVKSGEWKTQDPETVRRRLSAVEARFSEYAHDRANCFSISYEGMVNGPDRLEAMFDFLGAPYRPDEIEVILATPHSYAPTQENIARMFEEF